jgi:ribosomal-protein-alanine N-acetyltransferase
MTGTQAKLSTSGLQSTRVRLRELDPDSDGDAAFIVELLNDPDWIRYIRDAGVRDLEQARSYIRTGPQAMFRQHQHGLWCVERHLDGRPLGLCGLIRRDTLDDVDLGFGFLPLARGQGLAFEAAQATLDWARASLQLTRVVAIVLPDNLPSLKLLDTLGFRFERMLPPQGAAPSLQLLSLSL